MQNHDWSNSNLFAAGFILSFYFMNGFKFSFMKIFFRREHHVINIVKNVVDDHLKSLKASYRLHLITALTQAHNSQKSSELPVECPSNELLKSFKKSIQKINHSKSQSFLQDSWALILTGS